MHHWYQSKLNYSFGFKLPQFFVIVSEIPIVGVEFVLPCILMSCLEKILVLRRYASIREKLNWHCINKNELKAALLQSEVNLVQKSHLCMSGFVMFLASISTVLIQTSPFFMANSEIIIMLQKFFWLWALLFFTQHFFPLKVI